MSWPAHAGHPVGPAWSDDSFMLAHPCPDLIGKKGPTSKTNMSWPAHAGHPVGPAWSDDSFMLAHPCPDLIGKKGPTSKTNMSWPAHAGHPVGLAWSHDSFMLAHQCPDLIGTKGPTSKQTCHGPRMRATQWVSHGATTVSCSRTNAPLDREEGADIQNKHVMARACGPPSGSRTEPRQFATTRFAAGKVLRQSFDTLCRCRGIITSTSLRAGETARCISA